MLPRIQYITHPDENFSDLSWIDRLAKGGIKWVQLRIKKNHFEARHPGSDYTSFFTETLIRIAEKCKSLGVLLTVNDHYSFAIKANVDGAHIGKEDEAHEVVRNFLGDQKIVGATANAYDDILAYNTAILDYIGLGPYTFTTTKDKDKLSPALGLRGYASCIERLKTQHIDTPIFAIGGIEKEDVKGIMQTGVYGIALSGLIHKANFDLESIEEIVDLVEQNAKETSPII
ncbi:thiamine-phosphate diphosphorylase [Lishizhenia tianjinensis]|uniref:Thiamine-phosphate diphosphorylase n=1 Tax=Lishizhenia tianjinensis TaxID=477690 RepID=A0A1I6ZTR4_9FLAO|nr:thiamine phosphate synthase [Lishizhenia tianjinensis]SFT66027.1 thiamine-phosphate diphosphorylase [Lishizhenia tianjinensis]